VSAVSDLLPDTAWEPLRPFWEATGRSELRFPQCDRCRRFQWYPRALCGGCGGDAFSWTRVATRCEIYSFTIVRRAFLEGAERRVPFAVLQVQFPQAPGVTLLTNLADDAQASDLVVGAPAEVEFVDLPTPTGSISMPFVRLVTGPAG
jgi:uncharacterized OB-fold protein